MPQQPQRRHGCQWPINLRQVCIISVYVMSVASIALSLKLLVRVDPAHAPATAEAFTPLRLAAIGVAVGLVFIVMCALFLCVSLTDTSVTPTTHDVSVATDDPKALARCRVCLITVARTTRHCQCCNKCVDGFDHHCVYLNTCIGRKNVRPFRWLIAASIVYLSAQTALCCLAVAATSPSRDAKALVGLSILPAFGLLAMIVLAAFQAYIYAKGLTTYEFIVQCAHEQAKTTKLAPKHVVDVDIHIQSTALTAEHRIQFTRPFVDSQA
ncbi:Aste57867_18601 [Aphanomyces stellatus]|uniref:Palmitoyltransferase n=1 Tax=Aphanomyces stellatus TaxID=120398 RepID=A0A485LBD9_9STRA|nr:hypothetical protein As57867_018539 [Aphanomyces stellatus]VFT95336.1 Aste57867_18601 [Aphanomyces stellatus]